MHNKHAIFRAGTSGLVLSEPNKQAFPEAYRQKSRLVYYASQCNTIEVNSSFYKIPMAATLTKWANSVPDDFQFTIKLWRDITHSRGFEFNPALVDQFMKVAGYIGDKKGCLLIQIPPSITITKIEKLDELLKRVLLVDEPMPWKIAVEFRHRSWYTGSTYSLLEKHKAAIVLHDMPASGTMIPIRNTGFIYIRFHGVRGDYKGSYSATILQEYAARIRQWLAEGKEVYAYFNNTIGDAVGNLRDLVRLVEEAG